MAQLQNLQSVHDIDGTVQLCLFPHNTHCPADGFLRYPKCICLAKKTRVDGTTILTQPKCICLAKNTRIDGATILRQPKWMCLAKIPRIDGETIFAFVWPKKTE